MFCSTIIPTIGRPTLFRAVESVLNQEFSSEDFEVIVVNDSGCPLDEAGWQKSSRVQIINTNKRERSSARNVGAAIAKGEYLWFLDDDDWILPGAMECFWDLANKDRDATWMHGGIQIVDGMGKHLSEINSNLGGDCFAQIMGGAWVPIQASIIKSDFFFLVGGYKPFSTGQDLDLCRRVALKGNFVNTPLTVACLLRGQSWHTSTNYQRAPEDTKQSRDEILSESGTFTRLLASAGSSYWYGRIFRIYMSTVNWNLEKRRFATAISRAFFGIASLILSGKHTFSREFWAAVKAHHVPDALHSVMHALEQNSEDN